MKFLASFLLLIFALSCQAASVDVEGSECPRGLIGGIQALVKGIFDFIRNIFNRIFHFLGLIFSPLTGILHLPPFPDIPEMDTIKESLSAWWQQLTLNLRTSVEGTLDVIKNQPPLPGLPALSDIPTPKEAIAALKGQIQKIGIWLEDLKEKIIPKLPTLPTLPDIGASIKTVLGRVFEYLGKLPAIIVKFIIEIVLKVKGGIVNIFGDIGSSVGRALNTIQDDIKGDIGGLVNSFSDITANVPIVGQLAKNLQNLAEGENGLNLPNLSEIGDRLNLPDLTSGNLLNLPNLREGGNRLLGQLGGANTPISSNNNIQLSSNNDN